MSNGAKRVRFAYQRTTEGSSGCALAGDIAVNFYESKVSRDELDKKLLWWSRVERNSISNRIRRLARSFKRKNTGEVKHYLNVFKECSKAPSHSSSEYLEKAMLGVPIEVRGLECGFVPSMKAYRKQHTKEILRTQEQLAKGNLSQTFCTRVLSSRAIRSSRRSRVMARLMGEADALPSNPLAQL